MIGKSNNPKIILAQLKIIAKKLKTGISNEAIFEGLKEWVRVMHLNEEKERLNEQNPALGEHRYGDPAPDEKSSQKHLLYYLQKQGPGRRSETPFSEEDHTDSENERDEFHYRNLLKLSRGLWKKLIFIGKFFKEFLKKCPESDIAPFNLAVVDLVTSQKEWRCFRDMTPEEYRARYFAKFCNEEERLGGFPPMPNGIQKVLQPLDILLLVKELKPEALELFVKKVFGTVV